MPKRKEPRPPAKDGHTGKVTPIKPKSDADQESASCTVIGPVLKIGTGSRGGKGPRAQRQHGGRPTAHEQEIRRTAREQILRTKEAIGQESYAAFETLRDAHLGKIDPEESMARQRAADSLLKKAGIGDTVKIEGGPPVIVNLGGMPSYPKPGSDVDGLEPEDPDAHSDPPGA